MEAKHGANAAPIYVDFEPPCDWRNDDRNEILVLYLPEFKKEQLKIQISNMKTLKILGERCVDETKTSRFFKRITVPRDCNAKEIHAKFVDGLLQIIMPKKNSFADPKQEQVPKIKETGQLTSEKSKMEISQDQANEIPNSSNEEERVTKKIEIPSNVANFASTNDEIKSGFKSFSKIAMIVAVVTAVVAGLEALIVYSWFVLLA